MTKKQLGMVENYCRAYATNLNQVYGRYSAEKEKAFNWCTDKKARLHGFEPRICSANGWAFTYAFLYYNEDLDLCLCYETSCNSYHFVIDRQKLSDHHKSILNNRCYYKLEDKHGNKYQIHAQDVEHIMRGCE